MLRVLRVGLAIWRDSSFSVLRDLRDSRFGQPWRQVAKKVALANGRGNEYEIPTFPVGGCLQ